MSTSIVDGFEWPEKELKALDASIRLQFHTQYPHEEWIGPSVIELAIAAFEARRAERDEARLAVYNVGQLCGAAVQERDALKAERDELKAALKYDVYKIEAQYAATCEKYRAALERIKTYEVIGLAFTTIESLRMIAEQALSEGEEKVYE